MKPREVKELEDALDGLTAMPEWLRLVIIWGCVLALIGVGVLIGRMG